MLYVSSDVIQAIDRNIGRFAAERGGILGGRKTNEIDTFYFDELAILLSNNNKYIPSVNDLNAVLLDWQKKDVEFYGFIHSHESRQELSPTDIEYATVIACLLEKEIVMGIIGGNNSFPVKFFLISKTKSVKEITYEVF